MIKAVHVAEVAHRLGLSHSTDELERAKRRRERSPFGVGIAVGSDITVNRLYGRRLEAVASDGRDAFPIEVLAHDLTRTSSSRRWRMRRNARSAALHWARLRSSLPSSLSASTSATSSVRALSAALASPTWRKASAILALQPKVGCAGCPPQYQAQGDKK